MDKNELYITAELAHIELVEEEINDLSAAVSEMLEYFTKMLEVDVDNLEPTTHALQKDNRLRKDEVRESQIIDDLLENSPELEDRFIVIPNVL
jgi:aspartyl-tRNA(Asn)/glutamyl-tRNA(Gln) amidotransferase subunit C